MHKPILRDEQGRRLVHGSVVFAMNPFCGIRPLTPGIAQEKGPMHYEIKAQTLGLYVGPAPHEEDLALVSFEGPEGTTLPAVVSDPKNLHLVC